MAEDTQGTTVPVQVTQDAPMPSAEQKVPEQGQIDPEAAQTSAAPSQEVPSEGLPEGASNRTGQQFDKLREQLRQERAKREQLESTFRTLQPKPAPEPEPVIDPYTGQVDSRLTEIQNRAYQAERRAAQAEQAIANFYTEQQTREAIAAHPELDSTSKSFDKNLHVATRAIIMDSMVNPNDYSGKQLTYREAADMAKSMRNTQVDQARKEAATEAIEQLTPKEQASLEATGTPGRRDEVQAPLEDLRSRTRRGDIDAIVARIKDIPVVGKG